MQRLKGSLEVFFMIALALLILLGLFAAGIMHRANTVSYEERIDLALVLDNAGGGVFSLLNSGEAQAKHIETLGAYQEEDSQGLESTLQDMRTGMMQELSLKVLVSEEEALSLGPEPPEEAVSVETEIPLPCRKNGICRGELEVATW